MVKEKVEELNDEKCHLICVLIFYGLPGNPSAVVCTV
jgi:hypothetical protein